MNLEKYVIKSILMLFLLHPQVVSAQHSYPPQKPGWNADSLGNQRAVVRVKGNGQIAKAVIPWRNRNVTPDQKVLIIDSAANVSIENVYCLSTTKEQGEILFEPASGAGIYYVYYLPYKLGGRSRYYPDAEYLKRGAGLSAWTEKARKTKAVKSAEFLRLESVDAFNNNNPMEIISTASEVDSFLKLHKDKDYFVFPESREFPIRMQKHIPYRWVKKQLKESLTGQAKRGEYYAFQLGVWPVKNDLEDVTVTFSSLTSKAGNSISADSFNCINTHGITYTGQKMRRVVNVPKGNVQALWCGVQVPEEIIAGIYEGIATVKAKDSAPVQVRLSIEVLPQLAINGDAAEPWKLTRLPWLNSTLAQENTVIPPYIPLEVNQKAISLLGRKLILNENGLPEQIQSFFTEEMTGISTVPKDVLKLPFQFNITGSDNVKLKLVADHFSFTSKEPGRVTWQSKSSSPQLSMQVNGSLEFDGFASYEVRVIAKEDATLKDISMVVPLNPEASKYVLGLGQKGGRRPDALDWKWDVATKNQDGLWIGDVNAGLQLSLRDQHYRRPLNTNFYLQKPLLLPTSWGNDAKGGIRINTTSDLVTLTNYSGQRAVKKGDTLYYNFTLLITPFHPLNTEAQWNERYFHSYKPIDTVKQSGSNVINLHHANALNPYINYPFVAWKEMRSYIDSAHNAGLKVKIYNTVREVANRMYELYPLMSLGDEIFSTGPRKGYSWLQEHIDNEYIAAWFVPHYKDAAVINSGMSRWHNYYVEGMNWLVDSVGIDGIYLDDVAFDRVTMKRIKRVMTKNGHPGLIDLHSANQFNERDGFNNSANLYMEHFPYINRLWFGEYFDYEKGSPDFYLTEVSGIPFGLMGEMLQDGGNPWRGVVYGMTNRMPYQKEKPTHIWKAWDDFGIKGSRMIGYWVSDNPVKTDNESVLATVYLKEKTALVALASWAEKDAMTTLKIDWKQLGIDPAKAKIIAPEVPGFQPAASFRPGEAIPVQKNKGWMLIISSE